MSGLCGRALSAKAMVHPKTSAAHSVCLPIIVCGDSNAPDSRRLDAATAGTEPCCLPKTKTSRRVPAGTMHRRCGRLTRVLIGTGRASSTVSVPQAAG